MENYLINENTIMLQPYNYQTKIIEKEITYIINKQIINIIDESCKFYCSSYKGRVSSTNYLLGISYKVPIIINEYKEMIFFPTSSPQDRKCIWINYGFIEKYYQNGSVSVIEFKNNLKISLNISIRLLNNQILRSSRLESILKSKKQ